MFSVWYAFRKYVVIMVNKWLSTWSNGYPEMMSVWDGAWLTKEANGCWTATGQTSTRVKRTHFEWLHLLPRQAIYSIAHIFTNANSGIFLLNGDTLSHSQNFLLKFGCCKILRHAKWHFSCLSLNHADPRQSQRCDLYNLKSSFSAAVAINLNWKQDLAERKLHFAVAL